jgi:hypothetical protein
MREKLTNFTPWLIDVKFKPHGEDLDVRLKIKLADSKETALKFVNESSSVDE